MEKATEVLEKAKSGWQKMDKKKKIIMVSVIVGIIFFISILAYAKNKVNYVTLFTDLSYEDAGNIVNDLESKKIKYKLEDNGKRILIDDKKVDKYRLELAMDGNMPEDSSGFEIFDDMGMMVTDEDRKIMYQRALEGELQKSITSLDAVDLAKVHLVMSEKSIFETEEKPASASVILDLKKGEDISNEAIDGIASLVSGAVDNLPKENIKIIDSQGNLLSSRISDNEEGDSTATASKHQDMQLDFQKRMERNLLDLLEDVLGRGKVKVSVFADLDFDAEESTTITYEDPVVRSEQIIVSGDDIETEGEDAIIGDNPSNVIGRVTGEDAHYDRTTNNELSSETTTTIRAPGRINRMTTSVVYDGNLTNAQTEQIERIVATATGYDFDRDDLISIVGMEFDKSEEEALQAELDELREEEERADRINMFIKVGILAAISALILAIVVTLVRKKKREEEAIELEQLALEQSLAEKEELEEELKEMTNKISKDEEVEPLEVMLDKDEEQAKNYAKDHPELAADLIKAWLKD